ncbi:MAG: hypothetical protein F6K18_29690 [Okeania sp. SIO2C2]|uniref:hypothetical protein n=1 Tax=Okeania sp. SIO2C2 TaxID=2607787 RepID=UPI0013B61390|nr:hypothetical protein [Okeania sp. SIO2C2]NEP90656.1 hypothetical protein [Okeania sp. SIO2C2]
MSEFSAFDMSNTLESGGLSQESGGKKKEEEKEKVFLFYRSLSGHDITANPLQRYSIYSRKKKAFSYLQQKEGGKIWRCLSFQLLICQIH